jgi:hypothetical protein
MQIRAVRPKTGQGRKRSASRTNVCSKFHYVNVLLDVPGETVLSSDFGPWQHSGSPRSHLGLLFLSGFGRGAGAPSLIADRYTADRYTVSAGYIVSPPDTASSREDGCSGWSGRQVVYSSLGHRAGASGRSMQIRSPDGSAFAAVAVPPCRATARWKIARPMPMPPVLRVRDSSTR